MSGVIYKVTKAEFNEFLKKNTKMYLKDFNNSEKFPEFDTNRYIEKYDAYYINPQGAWILNTKCVSGEKQGNKYILNFESKETEGLEEYKSTMTLEKEGNNFVIISNEISVSDKYKSNNEILSDESSEKTNTKQSEEDIVKNLYVDKLKENNKINEEKFEESRIDSVRIITGVEKANLMKDLYPEAKETDIFATVTYSIKPVDINKTNWIAGNGKIEGEWITNKLSCVYIVEDNGVYTIKSDGTGW